MYKPDLEKVEEPEIKLQAFFLDHGKSEGSPGKHILVLLATLKPLTVWIITNCKILKEMGVPEHLTCLMSNLYMGLEAIESNMEQLTGSKLGKE